MTSVQMPQLGETIVEGTILKWLKHEGERIEVDEPLFELSTDKVDTEVPSLRRRGHHEDPRRRRGRPSPSGRRSPRSTRRRSGSATSGGASGASAPADRSAAAQEPVAADAVGAAAPGSASAATPAAPAPPTAAPVTPAASLPDRGPRSQILSPLVRKLADEHRLDLSRVRGTGTGGRITKKDVMDAVSAAGGTPAPAAPTAPAAVAPASTREPHPRCGAFRHPGSPWRARAKRSCR